MSAVVSFVYAGNANNRRYVLLKSYTETLVRGIDLAEGEQFKSFSISKMSNLSILFETTDEVQMYSRSELYAELGYPKGAEVLLDEFGAYELAEKAANKLQKEVAVAEDHYFVLTPVDSVCLDVGKATILVIPLGLEFYVDAVKVSEQEFRTYILELKK